MYFPKKEIVERLRKEYPVGTPPKGTKGTVRGVDDTGSLLVDWDNGSGLNVIYGIDKVKKFDTVKTI